MNTFESQYNVQQKYRVDQQQHPYDHVYRYECSESVVFFRKNKHDRQYVENQKNTEENYDRNGTIKMYV